MKQNLLLLLMLVGYINLGAENKTPAYQITGQVIEQNSGKTIPYATVTLQTDSAKTIKKLSSDVSGKFSVPVFEKRKYTLLLTALGYNEAKMSVEVTDAKTDVGKVSMAEGTMMKEVSVVAQKPLVKMDVDKITYSVEADPDAQTSNGLEMLRKVPLLTVDGDEKITLNGQTNFKVLVNGKSSSMMSNNFKEVIKSLPANSIKEIQVITNPSSKYDAEGVGGIINIITTKKTLNGYNGSVSGGFDTFGSFNGSAYVATKVNKFSFSGRLSLNQFKRPYSHSTNNRENFLSDEWRYTDAFSKNSAKGLYRNFSGEASYEIDSLNLLSMSFWGYAGNFDSKNDGETHISNLQYIDTKAYHTGFDGKNKYGTLSGNIDYQKSFKKPDKSFTVSYKLDNNPNDLNYYNRVDNLLNYTPYNQHSQSESFTREQTLQVDYNDPLSKIHQIECGVKAIFRQNESKSNTYLFDDAAQLWNRNDTLSNELDYNQYIVGAYAGYVCKLKKFSFKTGLRTELTWNDAVSKSVRDTSFTNQLQNVVPYINLSYQLKQGKTIKLSYTQRLYRPGIWYLNPYVNNTTREEISYGNPNLKSEIAHSFDMAYNENSSKVNFSARSYLAFTNNSIEEVSKINVNNVTETTYKNIGTNLRTGMSLYCSYRPNSKYNFSINGGANYYKMEANNGYQIKNDGFQYNGDFDSRIELWKESALSFNTGFATSGIQLQGKSGGYTYSGIGLSQNLLKKKLSLNLYLSAPFCKYRSYNWNTTDKYYTNYGEYTFPVRKLRFSVTYNFGKSNTEVKKAKRGISNDDMKSGGGGNGGN
jgi:hypothetical protein